MAGAASRQIQRSEQQRRQAAEKRHERKHLSDPQPSALFEHGRGATGAVAGILPCQGREGGPGIVGDGRRVVHPDPTAGGHEAFVELGILVRLEPFVITADREERLAVEGRVMAMIDEAGTATGEPMSGSAVAEPAVLGSRDGALHAGRADGLHGDDDGGGFPFR